MNRKAVTAIFIICIIIITAVAPANAADAVSASASQTVTASDESILYVDYNGHYMSLDKDGNVCADTVIRPTDQPELIGVEFTELTYGSKAVTETPAALEYAIEAEQFFNRYNIDVTSMVIENSMLTVRVNNLTIKMGKDYNTERKINDLADFIDQIINQTGTLYMQNENADKYGYSFRVG